MSLIFISNTEFYSTPALVNVGSDAVDSNIFSGLRDRLEVQLAAN